MRFFAVWLIVGLLAGVALAQSDYQVPPRMERDVPLSEIRYEEALQRLNDAPLFRMADDHMRQVAAYGRTLGRQSSTMLSVGDCNTESRLYLRPLLPDVSAPASFDDSYLQSDELMATIDYFGESLGYKGLTAHSGLNAFTVMDSFWSDRRRCDVGESPLDCEYRLQLPSVALIMFGANDLNVLTAAGYEAAFRDIIERSLSEGIVPVLSTFAHNPAYGPHARKAVIFNAILIELADEYDLPLMHFWLATQSIPDFGIMEDNAHLQFSGHDVRNQLSLIMLDHLRRNVLDG